MATQECMLMLIDILVSFHVSSHIRIIYHYYHSAAKMKHYGFPYGIRAASEALENGQYSLSIHYLHMSLRVSRAKRNEGNKLLHMLGFIRHTIKLAEWSSRTAHQLQYLHNLDKLISIMFSGNKWDVMAVFRKRKIGISAKA